MRPLVLCGLYFVGVYHGTMAYEMRPLWLKYQDRVAIKIQIANLHDNDFFYPADTVRTTVWWRAYWWLLITKSHTLDILPSHTHTHTHMQTKRYKHVSFRI